MIRFFMGIGIFMLLADAYDGHPNSLNGVALSEIIISFALLICIVLITVFAADKDK